MAKAEEKQKVKREKRAAFFYDISKMFLAGSGVSGFSPLLFNTGNEVNWFSVIIGVLVAYFFATLADRELKK